MVSVSVPKYQLEGRGRSGQDPGEVLLALPDRN
jgi:hypothetical protein